MNIKDFLKAYPLPQSNPKTIWVFERVQQMNLSLNSLNLNERATYFCTVDNARLDEVAKVAGMMVRKPDTLQPHRHLFIVHDKGTIILRGPEMRITETYEEI